MSEQKKTEAKSWKPVIVKANKSYNYAGDIVHCIESDEISHLAYVGRINEHGILWYRFWTEWHTLQEI